MAKIESVETALLNWARWHAGMSSGGLGYASINYEAALQGADRSRYHEAVVPTVACDAEETHRAVQALPSELRATVEDVYLKAGPMAKRCRRLCVTEATIYARIDRAHVLIQRWQSDLAATRREQRARTEATIAAARPA